MVNVPLRDMRNDSAEEVQKRALKEADNGIVLVYAGDNAQLGDTVRLIADECASRGFQVKSVLLANAEGGSGVTMYGQDGGPLGPKVNFDGDIKAQTAEQIERLRERLARVPSDTAARDPMDVPRCRYEPGYRLAGAQNQGLHHAAPGCHSHRGFEGLDEKRAGQGCQRADEAWGLNLRVTHSR